MNTYLNSYLCNNLQVLGIINLLGTMTNLKKKVKQQACPKGLITKVYLKAEGTFFASYYFGSNVPSMRTRCRRNEDDDEHINHFPTLSVFAPQGTCLLYTSPSPRDRTRSRMPSSA